MNGFFKFKMTHKFLICGINLLQFFEMLNYPYRLNQTLQDFVVKD